MQKADNVNHSATWKNDSVSTVVIPLNRQVSPSEIRQIRLVHLAQGGYMGGPTQGSFGAALATPAGPLAAAGSMATGVKSEDNWTMEDFQAMAIGPNNITIPIASAPMHRFTGSDPSMDIDTRGDASCPAADAVRELEFVFHTGNDDLRGGNDNVGITIQFADGTSQTAANVNEGRNWANGSTHSLTVILNRPVPRKQIKSVTLSTTFTGGPGGDNWNMDSVEITADGHPLVTSGFHRFSADWSGPKAKQLTIAIPMS
jgi:hypothetical protein